uniref:Uncharacterized protein n=1 Tax=Chrysemys picta bellii TaxID=8478 RepID=A0A8C3IXT7_CHRPI
MSARSSASSSSCWILRNLVRLTLDNIRNAPKCTNMGNTHSGLQFLDMLLATLQCQLLCLIQTELQVLHCLVQVLLHPLQVGAGAAGMAQLDLHFIQIPLHLLLYIQGALHGLHNSDMVPLHLINFLIFLSNLPVNFRLYLVQLKLDAEDFALFMF